MNLYVALRPITHNGEIFAAGSPVDFSGLTDRQRALQVKYKKARPASYSDVEGWKSSGKMPVKNAPEPVGLTDAALDLVTHSIIERGDEGQLTGQGKPTMEALRDELAVIGIQEPVTADQRDAAFARVTASN